MEFPISIESAGYKLEPPHSSFRDDVIISCLLVAALAAPPLQLDPKEPIPIVAQSNILNEDGTFQNSYESADGTKVEASGTLKDLGDKEGPSSVIQGSYSFVTADGQVFELRYIADENGFQPQASFLPVAPPIPEDIQRSLEYNAAHPEEDNLRK
ncbi:unnamed protein product [Timema podura]|uniref:Uncharacterized protein n=1 Tax=Timema podura TaxID=61482 RepID=A0ABN7NGJ7_TIMPD|nr:unnamed protein product [Timema podura]